jgi:serine protease AprX
MGMKRVIAYFMHERERDIGLTRMKDAAVTDSYLLGDVDESHIAELQKQGLVVQEVGEPAEPETPGGEAEPVPGYRRPSMRRLMLAGAPLPPVDTTQPNFYLLRLRGPLLEQWRDELTKQNVHLLEYVPRYSYTAKLTPEQVKSIQALPFLRQVRVYTPQDTGPISPRRAPAPPAAKVGVSMLTYDIRLHREEDVSEVINRLKNLGVSIAGASGRKVRLYLLEDSPLGDEIAAFPEVAAMEQYIPPKLHNDVARTLLGIDSAAGPGSAPNLPQTGAGQTVAVADTGLDDAHPDFQGRIAGIVARGRPGDYSDTHGHGTHVAGSVLGDGTASGGKVRGVAPQAKLFFQSLLDAEDGLGGLPLNLGDLFEEAYQAGARIHNNSWGSATASMYTINSIEVDEFIAKRRDMLIVISAGNEGQAAQRLHSQPGFVDWLSLGSPASCKNALTVGASRSKRNQGGYSNLPYGGAWPADFPDPPISQQSISGDPEALAAFSSRGPCDDRRIKPDVVAPGTDIASTKSSQAPLRHFWGPYPGNNCYAFMGGTSMAAPLVTGCAALVREYYVKDKNHQPSAALLRATLINSTRRLAAPDAIADHPYLPNFHQGFGCVHMPWAIPNPSEPWLQLAFLDTWTDGAHHFNQSGHRFRYAVTISGGSWLRICLAWTDVPGRALQNNLNLLVEVPGQTQKVLGNENLPLKLTPTDSDNNIEVVRIENPPPGKYLLQISATNLLRAGQDFALVVSGALTSALQEVQAGAI